MTLLNANPTSNSPTVIPPMALPGPWADSNFPASPESWWRRQWTRFTASAFDEAVGLLVLHRVMKYRRLPPVTGRAAAAFPDLFSGEIERFARPIPDPIDFNRILKVRRASWTARVEEGTFPSAVTSDFPSSDRVHVTRWRPVENRTDLSDLTVVGVEGVVQVDSTWFHRFARELLPAGIELVMVDAPFNHRRTPAGFRPGQLIMGGDLEHQLSVSRQAMLDLWTVIRSLQAAGRRVGLVGLSYGGWLSLSMATLADQLDFVTAIVPPVDMFRILQEGGTIVRAARRGLGPITRSLEEMQRISRALSPIVSRPRLDGDRITLHAARYDRFVPPARIAELARHWNARLIVHEDGHMGVGARQRYKVAVAQDIVTRFAVPRRWQANPEIESGMDGTS